MASSKTVANKFLHLAREKNDSLTPMQVLKLVYIAHGWMLGLYGRPLIDDEVQAWQYGPVIPTLYNSLRGYKGSPVTRDIPTLWSDALDRQQDDIVRQVYQMYGNRSGADLSRLTHAQGTPWCVTYEPGVFGSVIPTDLIEDHYHRLAVSRGAKLQ
ncbi:SocA family protein [Paraburkholderia aspalathi]|nr:SocA family protein [Paraburkholderia aspalathi]